MTLWISKGSCSHALQPLKWFDIANRWKGSLHNDRGGMHENTPFLICDHGLKKKPVKVNGLQLSSFCQNSISQKKKKKKIKKSPWQEKVRLKYKQSLWSPVAWLIFIPLPAWQDQILFKLWKPTRPSGWRPWMQSQFQGVPCTNAFDEIRYLASHLKNIWRTAVSSALHFHLKILLK